MDDIEAILWKYQDKAVQCRLAKDAALTDSRPDDMNKAEGAMMAYRSIVNDLRELMGNESRCGV